MFQIQSHYFKKTELTSGLSLLRRKGKLVAEDDCYALPNLSQLGKIINCVQAGFVLTANTIINLFRTSF